MLSLEVARKDWAEWARSRPIHDSMAITEEGLVLGAGTVLAKARVDRCGRPALAIDDAEPRILALLAVAYGKAVDPTVLDHIRRASEQWRRGESCLALIHLAYTGLSKLADEQEGSFRLFLAERALADGVAPSDLLKACGIDSTPLDLLRAGYNMRQPRVPKGNSRESGRWTTADASSVSPVSVRPHVEVVDYAPVHETPDDAVAVTTPYGGQIYDKDSTTKKLMAPPHADFRQVYAAGRAIASIPYSEQYRLAHAAIAQEGIYDFQRDVPQQKFYDAYVHASNYAVGVYMAGAGYSLDATRAMAKLYALRNSKNYDAQDQLDWIKRGWEDGSSGVWK